MEKNGKEKKVWVKIMYHFAGGILPCWWYFFEILFYLYHFLGGIFAYRWYVLYLCAK